MGDKCSESVHSFLNETAATNRFADYFVICGLDLNEGLEPDRFAGKINVYYDQTWFSFNLSSKQKKYLSECNFLFRSIKKNITRIRHNHTQLQMCDVF